MGRIPCCEKENVKRGQWTPEEDNKLSSYIAQHGTRNWRLIPKNAGLQRCGKSGRLRWTNYLRPDLKHGQFMDSEEQTIVKLHSVVGNRWLLIAAQLPGRTDNDVKNHWNTKLKKKLSGMGIDPVTHKPFSHLMAEIAMTLAPPQVAHLAEAALGCFKDEMLHLLTKKHMDFQFHHSAPSQTNNNNSNNNEASPDKNKDNSTIEKIKTELSRAMQEPNKNNMPWGANEFTSSFPISISGFQYGSSSFCNEGETSPWSQSVCSGSTCRVAEGGNGNANDFEQDVKDGRNLDSVFNSDCILWDLPSDHDMINQMV